MRSPVIGRIPVPSLPSVRSSADLPALLAYVVRCGRLSARERVRCLAYRRASRLYGEESNPTESAYWAARASRSATAIREYNRAARGAAALYNTLARRWERAAD